jgi:ABC-type xylose transport system substrate-binding protein
MRKSLFVGFFAVCSVLLFSGSTLLAADNWVGSWKLNLAKSKFSPGPAPKSLMLKFEASGDAITLTSDGVNAAGEATHGSYTSKFDGKDVPWTGNPDADTASARRIDANNYENTWKKGGKVTVTSKAVVSKDGKTLTASLTGKNSKGETINNTSVYDRQ